MQGVTLPRRRLRLLNTPCLGGEFVALVALKRRTRGAAFIRPIPALERIIGLELLRWQFPPIRYKNTVGVFLITAYRVSKARRHACQHVHVHVFTPLDWGLGRQMAHSTAAGLCILRTPGRLLLFSSFLTSRIPTILQPSCPHVRDTPSWRP